jgi:hypothetical protein
VKFIFNLAISEPAILVLKFKIGMAGLEVGMQSIWNPFAVSGEDSLEVVLEALIWLAKQTGRVVILTYGSLLLKASPEVPSP